jgi:prepilin-type N-terminal cleavage/methylation domain-containing protein
VIVRTSPPTGRCSRGFTLVEVLLALAIMAVLATVLIPQVVRRQRDGYAAAIATSISGVRSAAYEFRKGVGRYPSQIAHLATLPNAGTTDLCGRTVPVDWASTWKGPYLQQAVTTAGVAIRDATMLNALRRVPATAATVLADVFIDVVNVDQEVADIVEAAFDPAPGNFTTGMIRWTATGGGQGTLSLVTPVRGC